MGGGGEGGDPEGGEGWFGGLGVGVSLRSFWWDWVCSFY